jgi:hypothetical protein
MRREVDVKRRLVDIGNMRLKNGSENRSESNDGPQYCQEDFVV